MIYKLSRKCILPAAGAVLLLIMTGCGGAEKTDPVSEGFAMIETQDYEAAKELFSQAEEENIRTREALRGKGIAYLGEGNYDEAVSCFENALLLSSGILNDMDFDINYYLATAFYKKGDREEALRIYEAILDLRPEEADAWYLKGVLLTEKNDSEGAKEAFDKVAELLPDDYNRLIQIYNVLSDNGFAELGKGYLETAMQNGEKKMSNYEKGQISFYLEDYESARTYLERAGEEAGDQAVLLLGKTYETLGDNNYAISVYSTYLNGGVESPAVLNEMGLCRMAMGDYEGALQDFRTALKIKDNPLLQTLKYNEAVACEFIGDYEGARRLFSDYVRSFPDDENAQREYEFLKTR